MAYIIGDSITFNSYEIMKQIIIFLFLLNFSFAQAWANVSKEQISENTFFMIIDLIYVKLQNINLEKHIKLLEEKKLISEKDFKYQEVILYCNQAYLDFEYQDFLKKSNLKPDQRSLKILKESIDESKKEMEKKKIACNQLDINKISLIKLINNLDILLEKNDSTPQKISNVESIKENKKPVLDSL